ncbi:MAG: hypothetical protein WDN06_18555 [Asticcacaulis sp.]
MRSLLLGCFVSCLPAMALAAPQWCPVSPADAATAMGQAPASLTAALDSKPSPMRQVHTEGKLPGEGIRERSGEAEKTVADHAGRRLRLARRGGRRLSRPGHPLSQCLGGGLSSRLRSHR